MKLSTLSLERLYNEIKLERGDHKSGDAACLMEMTSLLAGEKHSDHPACACPAITRFAIGVNDRLPDDLRQMLKPYAPAFIGTRDGHEKQRCAYLANRAAKVFAPFYLRRAKLTELADKLAALHDNNWAVNRSECLQASAAAAYAAAAAAAAVAAAYAAYDAAVAAAVAAAAAKPAPIAVMPLILETFDDLIAIGAPRPQRCTIMTPVTQRASAPVAAMPQPLAAE